ncbi:MAG: HAMP domain-containing protein [Deltaproteobacteria bacterium]|nr:HAMP domain-containing protein [Deltaproteobacteria bacterium]
MKKNRKKKFSAAEGKKTKREAIVIIFFLLLVGLLTFAEICLSDISSEAQTVNDILIFFLINVVILLIVLLVYLVCRNIARILLERKRNPFGSKLRAKLVAAFVALSLIPTLLLFFVSASFINMSIKNWLHKQIESSLTESLEVAQTYYRDTATDALHFGRRIGAVVQQKGLLDGRGGGGLGQYVGRVRSEYNVEIVEVYSAGRDRLARSVSSHVPGNTSLELFPEDLAAALRGKEFSRVTSEGNADLIRGIVPVYSPDESRKVLGVVVVSYYMPDALVDKVQKISNAYQKYWQLKIRKSPIRSGYILTLFLITMVIIFLAIWFGIYLANSLSTPIRELAEATGQVAAGNLHVRLEGEGEDEIGMLVASFNKMTEDLLSNQNALRKANEGLTSSNQELEQRRRYMEIVLRNVTAGVISVDKRGVLTTVNTSAERLLNIVPEKVTGRHFREVLRPEQLDIIKGLLRDLVNSKKDSISKQVDIRLKDRKLTLLINLSIMRDENGDFLGTVVVFDDLTQLMKAQRMAAWREVARRIAHEIKNPLTPIKLSAQRLRKRYLSRFGEDEKVFDECTGMIIKSVDELKTLVDEFSSFARMPAAQPTPNNLNEIIREALTLYQEAHRDVAFAFLPDEAVPMLRLDRDQIKRVLINLLDNAIAALDEVGDIRIETRYDRELRMATLTVADTGHGIAPEDKPRLFEPYFSTKKTGTGLGLAIVTTIVADHGGFIRVKDNEPRGTVFIIEFPAGGEYV